MKGEILVFVILNSEKKPVMQTTSPACIPDEGLLKIMRNSGYKFTIDGKVASDAVIAAARK